MEKLREAHEAWKRFTLDREEARVKAQEAEGERSPQLKLDLLDAQRRLEEAKAEVAYLKEKLAQQPRSYNKARFEAAWSVEKEQRRAALEQAIANELRDPEMKPYMLAAELGSRNTAMFYQVSKNMNLYAKQQEEAFADHDWQWSRFTGTHRYAIGLDKNENTVVQIKGTIGTEFEGLSAVFDLETGDFIFGSRAVYNSDSAANRQKRARMLTDVLAGTYTGKIKEAPNPYYEEVEDSDED